MNIKKMIKNSITNDVFIKPIHSDNKEFDGRYFIFIRSAELVFPKNDQELMFRAKITKDKKIPSTVEEINEAEYIQFSIMDYIEALDLEEKHPENKQDLDPDEFGYLPVYRKWFFPKSGRKYPEDLEYIGNFNVKLPEKEYVDDDSVHMIATIWDDVNQDLIKNYQTYNERDPKLYNHERAEIRKNNYLLDKKITEEVNRHTEEIMAKYGDEIARILAKEPYTEESLTYVGPEDDEED